MNYFLATASYEHFLLQYLAYGFSLPKSLPHQIQQRYKGLIISLHRSQGKSSPVSRCFGFIHLYNFFSCIYLMTKFTHNWSSKSFFNRPTSFKTIFQNTPFKTHIFRPLRKWFSNPFISKQPIICAIKVLLPKTNPSTVFFTIMSIRVNTVNTYSNFTRFLIRFIHILFKFLKRLPQNLYSSAPVIFEAIMFRIFTPLLHTTPNIIKSCSRHSMFHSLSLANSGMIVNQFYTPLWITKSQLEEIWKKANNKK